MPTELKREILADFNPYPAHGNPTITNYQNELLRINDALEDEEKGRRFIRRVFSRKLIQNLTPLSHDGKIERKGKRSLLHSL